MHLLLSLLLLLSPFALSAAKCQAFFSPDDQVASKLISLIDEEKESVAVAAYTFSHGQIANALIAAHGRGVKVEVIVDPYSLKFSSLLKKMAKAGIPVWIWNATSEEGSSLMHDKFCLFGERAIWTGSFNFTQRADKANQENAILIQDKEIAKKFKLQYQKILERGCRRFEVKLNDK